MPMSRAVSSAWIRTPSSKVAAEPVQERDDDGVAGLDRAHQVPPARAIHGAAAGHVGENQVLAYAVVGQQAQLRVQVLGIVVGLADPGVAVGSSNGAPASLDHDLMDGITIDPPRNPLNKAGLLWHSLAEPASAC